MSVALYYVLREGLVRGQGRYWLGYSAGPNDPATCAKQRASFPLGGSVRARDRAERYTADGYPMRVVAAVTRRK